MGIDIRIPIGILFSIFGIMLTAFGVLGDRSIYARSLNININLWWGIVMVLFGLLMLGLAYYGRAVSAKSKAMTPAQRLPPTDDEIRAHRSSYPSRRRDGETI